MTGASGRDGGSQRRRIPDQGRPSRAARPLNGASTGRDGRPRNGYPSRADRYDGSRDARYDAAAGNPRRSGQRQPDRAYSGNPRDARRAGSAYGATRSRDPRGARFDDGAPYRQPSQAGARAQAPAPASASGTSAGSVQGVFWSILRVIVRAVSIFLSAVARAFSALWRRSRVAAVGVVVVALVGCFMLVDSAANGDKIASGVRVGEIDVSGMTVEEAASAIDSKYTPNLKATTVYIFADEETANSADVELQIIENEALAEQLSFEEAQNDKKLWITSAGDLEASVPSQQLAQEAFERGRSFGFFERVGLASPEAVVDARASFDETLLSGLISDINSALGSPVEDYGIAIEGGEVSVTEGRDGMLLDNEEFSKELSDVLLADDSSLSSFVAEVKDAHYRIDGEAANLTKQAIEAAVPDSVGFESDGESISMDRETLLGWISTEARERDGGDGGWFLDPFVDASAASQDILAAVNVHVIGEDVNVSFDKSEDGSVRVNSDKEVAVPNIEEALSTLDGALFAGFRDTMEPKESDISGAIGITTRQGASSFSVEEAISYGLVSRFSSYTTQFTNTSSTANRRDNIHLVSDTIDNTVAKADGGEWSFLDHSGAMEADDGYKEAGVIVGGKLEQGVGGGVCQVATTVFNAVYQGGLPVDERHNHTLYSSSYPAGLDAAVSYPSLDLVWSNPTSSDILLQTGYTDSSVTVTLVGIDPKREVTTETGEWEEGKKHSTEYEVDENLKPDASYIKTAASDGMKILVKRTVKDEDGKVLFQDAFSSVYSPVNRVIAYGEGSDMAELKRKYAEADDE